MQLSLTRGPRAVSHERPVHAGYSKGNTGVDEATTAPTTPEPCGFRFDDGTTTSISPHVQSERVVPIPGSGPLTGGWSIGGIANARSGLPIPVLITRNDIVYVDAAGAFWNNAAAGRTAVINVPGGGASRSTRRPDLIPGVDPFIKDGGRIFLNPAAFATPLPGTFFATSSATRFTDHTSTR